MLFDLIRKIGRQTRTTDKCWQRKDCRGATATTENLKGQSRQEQMQLHNPTNSKHTTAHYGNCEKSEMIVTIKCET